LTKCALLFGQYGCSECVLLQGWIQIRHSYAQTELGERFLTGFLCMISCVAIGFARSVSYLHYNNISLFATLSEACWWCFL